MLTKKKLFNINIKHGISTNKSDVITCVFHQFLILCSVEKSEKLEDGNKTRTEKI